MPYSTPYNFLGHEAHVSGPQVCSSVSWYFEFGHIEIQGWMQSGKWGPKWPKWTFSLFSFRRTFLTLPHEVRWWVGIPGPTAREFHAVCSTVWSSQKQNFENQNPGKNAGFAHSSFGLEFMLISTPYNFLGHAAHVPRPQVCSFGLGFFDCRHVEIPGRMKKVESEHFSWKKLFALSNRTYALIHAFNTL